MMRAKSVLPNLLDDGLPSDKASRFMVRLCEVRRNAFATWMGRYRSMKSHAAIERAVDEAVAGAERKALA